MKFNYIVGNPPYQAPSNNAGRGSKKLYYSITSRMLDRYKEQMGFITPKPILIESGINPCYEKIQQTVNTIFNAEEYFKEATNAIAFILGEPKKNINYNSNPIPRDKLYICYSENAENFYPLYLKLSYKHNGFKKLKIKPSHQSSGLGIKAKYLM